MAKRILVVDDEEMLRALIARALRDDGYEVMEAENGLVALDLVRQADPPPDLVISDNSMPGLTGLQLADRLRELYPQLPVLHLRSHGAAADPALPAIFKPFNRADFLQTVRALVTE